MYDARHGLLHRLSVDVKLSNDAICGVRAQLTSEQEVPCVEPTILRLVGSMVQRWFLRCMIPPL